MRALIVASLLAAMPAVALAQPAPPLERGEQLRREGRPEEAIPLLEAATRESPRDADAWLNLGLAYAVTGRLSEAEATLDRAQALAPDYPDVQIARARVAYFRSDPAEASRRLAPVFAAHPDNAEAQDLARQIALARASVTPWRLDLAYTHGSLSDDLPDAATGFVSLTHRFAGGRTLGLAVENARQFGQTDTYAEVTVATRRAYLTLGGAPDADFRPEVAIRGGVYADPLAWGDWKAQFLVDAGWARHVTGDVHTLSPGVDLSNDDRLSARIRWITVLDESDAYRMGYSLHGEWRAAERFSVFAGWADAPESSDGRTVRVKTLSGGVAVGAGASTTVRLGLAHAMRSAYDRDDVTLSVTRRF